MARRILEQAEIALARERPGVGDYELCRAGLAEVRDLVEGGYCPMCILELNWKGHCPDCDRFTSTVSDATELDGF